MTLGLTRKQLLWGQHFLQTQDKSAAKSFNWNVKKKFSEHIEAYRWHFIAFMYLMEVHENDIYPYSDSQQHESSCLLSDCFPCISPEPLELKKSYLHFFASLSKELSDERIVFQIRSQYQLIFAKTLFWQKKVSYWKKSAILKNSKYFFHGSKV